MKCCSVVVYFFLILLCKSVMDSSILGPCIPQATRGIFHRAPPGGGDSAAVLLMGVRISDINKGKSVIFLTTQARGFTGEYLHPTSLTPRGICQQISPDPRDFAFARVIHGPRFEPSITLVFYYYRRIYYGFGSYSDLGSVMMISLDSA